MRPPSPPLLFAGMVFVRWQSGRRSGWSRAYYRKSARFAVFIILLASFAIPSVLASGSGLSQPLAERERQREYALRVRPPVFPVHRLLSGERRGLGLGDLLGQRLPHGLNHDLRPRQGDRQARDPDTGPHPGRFQPQPDELPEPEPVGGEQPAGQLRTSASRSSTGTPTGSPPRTSRDAPAARASSRTPP